jgi:cell division protein FtsB
MFEFWLKEKLLLIIGLFQFGLILIMVTIINLSKLIWRKLILDKQDVSNQSNLNEIKSAAIAPSSPNNAKDVVNNLANNEISLEAQLTDLSDQSLVSSTDLIANQANLPEIDPTYKVDIAPELLTELLEITDNPAAIIDEAIRWWLRRRNADDLDNGNRDRRYPVSLRSYDSRRSLQDTWND